MDWLENVLPAINPLSDSWTLTNASVVGTSVNIQPGGNIQVNLLPAELLYIPTAFRIRVQHNSDSTWLSGKVAVTLNVTMEDTSVSFIRSALNKDMTSDYGFISDEYTSIPSGKFTSCIVMLENKSASTISISDIFELLPSLDVDTATLSTIQEKLPKILLTYNAAATTTSPGVEETILQLAVPVLADTYLSIFTTVTGTISTNDDVELCVYYNSDEVQGLPVKQTMSAGFFHFAIPTIISSANKGIQVIRLSLKAMTATLGIQPLKAMLTVQGSSMSGLSPWNGLVPIYETDVMYFNSGVALNALASALDTCDILMIEPLLQSIVETAQTVEVLGNLNHTPTLTDNLPSNSCSVTNISNTNICMTLFNPACALGVPDKNTFSVTGFISGTPTIVAVSSISMEIVPGTNYLPTYWSQGDISNGSNVDSLTVIRTGYASITPGSYTLTFMMPYADLLGTEVRLGHYRESQLDYYTERQLEGLRYSVRIHYYNGTTYINSSDLISSSGTIVIPEGTTQIRLTMQENSGVDITSIDAECITLRLEVGVSTLYQYSNKINLVVEDLSVFSSTISININNANIITFDGTELNFTTTFERVIY